MAVVICVAVLFFIWFVHTGVKKNNFNIWDLVQDVKAEGMRVASVIKSTFVSSFLVSTMVIIDQEFKNTLTEGMFGLYLGTWCASLIAKVVFDKSGPIAIPTAGDK
jgi:hypothetical protein